VKRLIILTGAAAMLLAAAACSSGGSSGLSLSPTASAASTSDNGGGESQSTSSTGGKITSADQLANTQACDLLTTSESARVGLPSNPSDHDTAGAKSGCQWDGDEFSSGILIRTDVGLSGVEAVQGTPVDITVGSHQAKQLKENNGTGCLIAIGITDSMRVDVQSTVVDTGDACQESLSIARIVEPKLP
jgi:hypothetical protein